MGGYGSMSIVLKNNRKLLTKRDRFKGLCGNETDRTEYNFPKASPQLLRQIKKRMIEERQSRDKKIIVIWSLILVTSISLFLYLL